MCATHILCFFFFSSRRRHTRCGRDWSSDVCSSDLDLDGATIEQMLVRSPVGMLVDLSEGSKSAGGGSRAGVAQRLRRAVSGALENSPRRPGDTRAPLQKPGPPAGGLRALLPVPPRPEPPAP